MKRLLISSVFAGLLLMTGSVNAQSASTASTPGMAVSGVVAPDTSQLKQYVGNYTVATGDVKEIIVTLEQGKLVGEAVGLGQSTLQPDADQRDAFIVPDPNGGSDVVRVISRDRKKTYLMKLTRPVERQSGGNLDASITLGETAAGAPPKVKAWYPQNETRGREFIY